MNSLLSITSVLLLLLFSVTACSPKVENRGHSDLSEKINLIKANISHKQDVVRLLGTPSTVSDFGQETWYYIHTRKETLLFFKPKIVEQDVLAIRFNKSGVVTETGYYNQNDIKQLEIAKDITPTEGHSLGFIEQIIGNLGKFNKMPQEAR